MNKLIRNCLIYDPTLPGHYRADQDILIDGDTIHRIGPSEDPGGDHETFDGRNKLAIPGLINAHTHSAENVLRGSTERMPLELWLIRQFTSRANFPPRLIYLITLAGAAEMLRSGTTSVLDHYWMAATLTQDGLDAVMQAYLDSGMRASVAPMLEDQDLVLDHARRLTPAFFDPHQPVTAGLPASAQLEIVGELIEHWHHKGDGRLRCLPGPGGSQWCSRDLLEGCRELAESHGTGVHIHVAETEAQAIACQNAYTHSAVQELKKWGLLRSDCSLAHCIWLSAADLDLIAEQQVSLVHNPVSNLKLGSGLASIPEIIQRNIPLALGTDGAASNDNQNMFTVLKLTGLLHSPPVWDSQTWISARQVMEMATVGGAKVLDIDILGRLQEGNLADIALIDLGRSYQQPLENASTYLVYCETGAAVTDVMVNGQWIVQDSHITYFNEDHTHQELLENLTAYEAENPRPMNEVETSMKNWSQALAAILEEREN